MQIVCQEMMQGIKFFSESLPGLRYATASYLSCCRLELVSQCNKTQFYCNGYRALQVIKSQIQPQLSPPPSKLEELCHWNKIIPRVFSAAEL